MKRHWIGCILFVLFILVFPFTDGSAGTQEFYTVVVPPPLEFPAPPDIVVVPNPLFKLQYVYMIPGKKGVYLYEGRWYRKYGRFWFAALSYDGTWNHINLTDVHRAIQSIPEEYALVILESHPRVRLDDYNCFWIAWGKSQYWHKYKWFNYEMQAEAYSKKMARIENYRKNNPP